MTKKQIVKMYREWRKANGNKKPNRVIVRMYWEDESPEETRVDTIGLEPENYWTDHDNPAILWYSSSLDGLYQLTKPGNGSDFVVVEVLEFYKVKN